MTAASPVARVGDDVAHGVGRLDRRKRGFVALAWTGTAIAQNDVKKRTDAARAVATEFGMTLVGELQKAIAAGGAGKCHRRLQHYRPQDRCGHVGRKKDEDRPYQSQASAADRDCSQELLDTIEPSQPRGLAAAIASGAAS